MLLFVFFLHHYMYRKASSRLRPALVVYFDVSMEYAISMKLMIWLYMIENVFSLSRDFSNNMRNFLPDFFILFSDSLVLLELDKAYWNREIISDLKSAKLMRDYLFFFFMKSLKIHGWNKLFSIFIINTAMFWVWHSILQSRDATTYMYVCKVLNFDMNRNRWINWSILMS